MVWKNRIQKKVRFEHYEGEAKQEVGMFNMSFLTRKLYKIDSISAK